MCTINTDNFFDLKLNQTKFQDNKNNNLVHIKLNPNLSPNCKCIICTASKISLSKF